MGVIFPYFWFFDVFFTLILFAKKAFSQSKENIYFHFPNFWSVSMQNAKSSGANVYQIAKYFIFGFVGPKTKILDPRLFEICPF
jgi:hypothetical protein